MHKILAFSAFAFIALAPGAAQAGGLFKSTPLLGSLTGVVTQVATKDVNVLNGLTIAVGNNSPVLSGNAVASGNTLLNGVGIFNGNGILGLVGGSSGHKKW